MAFTTTTRINDLIKQGGTGIHGAPDADAITNAVAAANAEIEKRGVASTETDAGLLGAADMLALAYLADGLVLQAGLRGDAPPSLQSLAQYAVMLRKSAHETADMYISRTRRSTQAAENRNWASGRGGPLYLGSEAGRYRRSTR